MPEFPEKNYGRCPLGHNPQPSGATGDDISTTQIGTGEEQPLFWSTYHQKYVCAMHKRRVQDKKDEVPFHDKQVEITKKLQGMGWKNA